MGFGTGSYFAKSKTKDVRRKKNPTSLAAIRPSTLAEAAPRGAALQDGDRLSHGLNKTRRATVVEKRGNKEEDPFDKPPPVTEKDVEIVLRRSKLKMMTDVAVKNVMTLIDGRIISALQSCTAES